MKTKRLIPSATAAVLALATLTAFAQWSEWQRMSGSGDLSMRSAQSGDTCAFAFRNDTTNKTLVSAKIQYIHNGRVDNDIMVQMGPQQSVGGWTAYSVEDKCSNVRVQVSEEQWR